MSVEPRLDAGLKVILPSGLMLSNNNPSIQVLEGLGAYTWPYGQRYKCKTAVVSEPAGLHGAQLGLEEALSDVAAAPGEARGEGFRPPSSKALENAKQLLCRMFRVYPDEGHDLYDVYPTPDAEVAISVSGRDRERSVLVLCGSNGDVRCYVDLDGRRRRVFYDAESFSDLTDDFMWAALNDLDRTRQIKSAWSILSHSGGTEYGGFTEH